MILKNGKNLIVRQSNISDASKLIDAIKKTGSETENLIVTPDEFSLTLDQEISYIKSIKDNPKSNHLVAIIDDEIVGLCGLNGRNNRRRVSHVASLGITILKDYWNLGIGYQLIQEQIKYAKANGIIKIDLEVRVDNEAAINLYKKCGFEIEGVHKRAMNVSTGYIDNYYMGLIIE